MLEVFLSTFRVFIAYASTTTDKKVKHVSIFLVHPLCIHFHTRKIFKEIKFNKKFLNFSLF